MRFLRVTGAGGTGGGQRGGSLPGLPAPLPSAPGWPRENENRGNPGSGWYARRPCFLCPGIDAVSRARAAFILATLTFGAWLVAPGWPVSAAASPYPSTTVELAGHGWGPGRGPGPDRRARFAPQRAANPQAP